MEINIKEQNLWEIYR